MQAYFFLYVLHQYLPINTVHQQPAFVAAAQLTMYSDGRTVFRTVVLLLGTWTSEVTIIKYILNYGYMIPEKEMFICKFSIAVQLNNH